MESFRWANKNQRKTIECERVLPSAGEGGSRRDPLFWARKKGVDRGERGFEKAFLSSPDVARR